MNKLTINSIEKNIAGKDAWGFKLGIGSFMTIDLGEKILNERNGVVYGEWHLWIQCCAWRIDKNKKMWIGSEDNRESIINKINLLSNLQLQRLQINRYNLSATLYFTDEIILRLFPFITEEYEHWVLFTPSNKVLIAGPGNNYSFR